MTERKRKAVTYRIDEVIIQAVEKIAKENNSSVNRYIENLLYAHCRELGRLIDVEPLGETRGGSRKSGKDKEIGMNE